MHNQSYDDYIRSILGYPSTTNMFDTSNMYQPLNNYQTEQNSELEDCYPEIYKIIYPMVQNRCRNITRPVTRELLDSMTNEIYMAIEGNQEVQININLGNDVRSTENRNSQLKKETKVENSRQQVFSEDRQIGQFRNTTLRDLIRILLLRELLGRPGNRPPRPPFPPRPPLPPMRPPFPGRPPMMPRDFENNYDIFERPM